MKKIISILLSGILAVSSFATAFAEPQAEAEVKTSVALGEEEGVLDALGIIDASEETGDAVMTRLEFAAFLADFLKIDTQAYENKRYFKDVAVSNRYTGAVNAMVDYSLMRGTGEYEFSPDEPIYTEDAARVVLKAIDVPDVYIEYNKSIKKDLLKGISGATQTRSGMIKLFYNALMLPYVNMTAISEEPKYDISKGYTVMEELFDVKKVEGVRVTGAEGCAFEGSVSNTGVALDKVEYKNEADNAYALIGHYVNAYIKINEKTQDSVIFLYDKSSDGEVLRVSAEDFSGIGDDYVVSYIKNNKKATVSLPKNVKVLKNGESVLEKVKDAFNVKRGYYTFVKNRSGLFDCVLISEYENFFLTRVDGSILYLRDKGSLDLDTYENLRSAIYDADGKEITAAELETNALISVFKSKTSIEVYMTGKVLSGKIEKAYKKDGYTYVTVGENDYAADKDFAALNSAKLQVGMSGVYLLDIEGRIAYIEAETTNSAYTFGYLVKCANKDSSMGDVKIKIYSTADKFEVLSLEDKITLDGERLEDTKACEKLEEQIGADYGVAIRYELNEDGLVRLIDTPVYNSQYESANTLRIKDSKKNMHYMQANKTFSVYSPIGAKTITFNIPDSSNFAALNETDFSMTSTYFDYYVYPVESYTMGDETIIPDILVVGPTSSVSTKLSDPAVFSEMTQVLDENDKLRYKITYIDQTGEKSVLVASEFSTAGDGHISYNDLESGDIFKYNLNSKSEIKSITKIFDINKDKQIDTSHLNAYKVWSTWDTEYTGYVKKVEDGWIQYGPQLNDDTDDVLIKHLSYYKTVVYDSSKRENKVYMGSLEDVLSYESSGADCSYIFTVQRNGHSTFTVVYKNSSNLFK